MFKWFVINQWRSARRSSIWQKNLAVNIFIGFLAVMMLGYLVLIGFMADKILLEVVKNKDPENVMSSILLFYFMINFTLRFFIQSIPAMQAIPYLHLPVKRSSLARFLTLSSLVSFFNWLPFFLFLPFTLKWMMAFHAPVSSILWFLSILFFEWTVNFILIWFKRKNTDKPWFGLVLIALIILLFVLDKISPISISDISEWYFMGLLNNPWFIILPVFTTLFWYVYNLKFIKKIIYVESLTPKSQHRVSATSFDKLRSFGVIGELMLKEVRLLFRNKRSKTLIYLIPFFLLYGLFFYPQEVYMNKVGMLVFVGIFITGGFLIAYGQYMLAWESMHFDFIITSNTKWEDFFRAKYYLIVIPTVTLYFLTIPYIYFGKEIFWLNLAAMIYNIGVNANLLLYTASFNKKRMELAKGAMMNYQGVGINNFIMALPLLVGPILIFLPFKFFFGYQAGVMALAVLGIIGFSLHRILIRSAVKLFESKRYEIAEGYRKKA